MKSLLILLATTMLGSSPLWAVTDLGDCSPEAMGAAPAGSVCHTSSADWRVENETYAGKRVYRDLKSGLEVTEPLGGNSLQQAAAQRCTSGWRLPTGYPVDFEGKDGFPVQESEFLVLGADNIRHIVPGTKCDWFWSSSINPGDEDVGFLFDSCGDPGGMETLFRDQHPGAVLCVRSGSPLEGFCALRGSYVFARQGR